MTEQALWVNVLVRAIDDAHGRKIRDATNRQRLVISFEARRWLAHPEFAEQRQIVCDAAGVDISTLDKYVRDHGLHRGIDLDLLRSYQNCAVCGGLMEPDANSKKKYCGPLCVRAAESRARRANRKNRVRPYRIASPAVLRGLCDWCGGPLPKGARARTFYCCPKCQREAAARAKYEKRRAAYGDRACLTCGEAIPPSAHGSMKYCSSACQRGRYGVSVQVTS